MSSTHELLNNELKWTQGSVKFIGTLNERLNASKRHYEYFVNQELNDSEAGPEPVFQKYKASMYRILKDRHCF